MNLELPPGIRCPWLIDTALKGFSIMLKYPLRIPLKLGYNFLVVEESLTPSPKWSCPYVELYFLVLIRDRYRMFSEL